MCQTCSASSPWVSPDGLGGAYVVWNESRTPDFYWDVYVQRVTVDGTLAPGWPADGVAVATGSVDQVIGYRHGIAPDGSHGLLLAWFDSRVEQITRPDIYAQRIRLDGSLAPGWTPNGVPVTRLPGYQTSAAILNDAGGAFVTWYNLTSPDIYLQRLNPMGGVSAGWPMDGIPISTLPATQAAPEVVSDGAGGAILVWGDLRDGTIDLYAQRVGPDGTIHWAADGVRMLTDRAFRAVVADGAGGAYAAGATLQGGGDGHYFLQRFTGDGALASGWPAEGVPICTAPDERQGLRMEPDGLGGVLLSWSDYRDFFESDVFVTRIGPDGQRAPGWPENGLRVTDGPEHNTYIDLAPDGLGGAYVCWDLSTSPNRVAVTHLTGAGTVAPGWPAGGLLIPGAIQDKPTITADGLGGAIVVWETWEDDNYRLRAQRVGPSGIVATTVALERAAAHPERVELVWRIAAPGFRAALERSDGTTWHEVTTLTADAAGRLTWVDREVLSGARYGYRLRYTESGTEHYTAETWVEVPAPLALTLHGLRPNPGTNPVQVSLALPTAAHARLDVFDLAGRRVAGRELTGAAPGQHLVRLDEADLAPGVYVLRLTHDGRALHVRAVVTR